MKQSFTKFKKIIKITVNETINGHMNKPELDKNSCVAPIIHNPANKRNLKNQEERTVVVKIRKRSTVDLPESSSLCNQNFL